MPGIKDAFKSMLRSLPEAAALSVWSATDNDALVRNYLAEKEAQRQSELFMERLRQEREFQRERLAAEQAWQREKWDYEKGRDEKLSQRAFIMDYLPKGRGDLPPEYVPMAAKMAGLDPGLFSAMDAGLGPLTPSQEREQTLNALTDPAMQQILELQRRNKVADLRAELTERSKFSRAAGDYDLPSRGDLAYMITDPDIDPETKKRLIAAAELGAKLDAKAAGQRTTATAQAGQLEDLKRFWAADYDLNLLRNAPRIRSDPLARAGLTVIDELIEEATTAEEVRVLVQFGRAFLEKAVTADVEESDLRAVEALR